MKSTIITLTVVLAAFVLGYLLGAPKAQTFNSSAAIAAPAPVPMAAPAPARCGNIHEAASALRSAMEELDRDPSRNFCGHRNDAKAAIRNALGQLKQAEDCADCR